MIYREVELVVERQDRIEVARAYRLGDLRLQPAQACDVRCGRTLCGQPGSGSLYAMRTAKTSSIVWGVTSATIRPSREEFSRKPSASNRCRASFAPGSG